MYIYLKKVEILNKYERISRIELCALGLVATGLRINWGARVAVKPSSPISRLLLAPPLTHHLGQNSRQK